MINSVYVVAYAFRVVMMVLFSFLLPFFFSTAVLFSCSFFSADIVCVVVRFRYMSTLVDFMA